MFGLFNKEQKSGTIVTKINKTGNQVAYENEVRRNAISQNNICPDCGHINTKDGLKLGFRIERSDVKGFWGECEKCGAEWETTYRY